MPRRSETTVQHLVDKRFVGHTPDGQRVMIDGEATAKTGMNPMQLVLNAVGACAAFDVVEMLRKRRLEVRDYRVELIGEREDDTPSPYTHIRVRHVLDVPGLERSMAERFVHLASTKYCSVAASLKADVEDEVELVHEDAAGAEPA